MKPVTARLAAAAAVTTMPLSPAVRPSAPSVAVIDCAPAVSSAVLKVCTPSSAGEPTVVNVYGVSPAKPACVSLLVSATVPV